MRRILADKRRAGKQWQWATLMACLPASGSLAMSVFTIIDDYEELGIPHVNLVLYCSVLGLGVLLHAGFEATRSAIARSRRSSRRSSRAPSISSADAESFALIPKAKNESEC